MRFRSTSGGKLDDSKANIYGNHILNMLKVRNIKSITAQEILEDAKDVDAPYHEYFDWEDSSAAEKYRIAQARQLIASIVEVKIIHEEEVPVRVFVNVVDENGTKAYVPTTYAMVRPTMANQVIAQALKEVKTWKNKYLEYKELAKIRMAIEDTEQEFIIGED